MCVAYCCFGLIVLTTIYRKLTIIGSVYTFIIMVCTQQSVTKTSCSATPGVYYSLIRAYALYPTMEKLTLSI